MTKALSWLRDVLLAMSTLRNIQFNGSIPNLPKLSPQPTAATRTVAFSTRQSDGGQRSAGFACGAGAFCQGHRRERYRARRPKLTISIVPSPSGQQRPEKAMPPHCGCRLPNPRLSATMLVQSKTKINIAPNGRTHSVVIHCRGKPLRLLG
jgi:hypothetical protein